MKNGLHIVFLLRLSPVMPFPLLSYIFGVSKIDFVEYATGTLLGLLPATLIETYLGQEMKNLTDALDRSSHNTSYTWLILISLATIVSLAFVSYISHKALKGAMIAEQQQQQSSSSSSSSSSNNATQSPKNLQQITPSDSLSELPLDNRTTTSPKTIRHSPTPSSSSSSSS
eukprot:CAMPEP_0201555912 /NCGR_PEP_ID=MMETSP0173_2-20130828/52061_1 /ASSEMBLY_ACC=CAM_ASM_000268 /TAXON_ID=218659 /ORGANISM="Vexillifera sp., Strain DIVA3 564/2" /LENGTH=170 /DNA_ID=CAMNT_0047967925 /DNA_START=414 /DNA_END=923 /DNA_ORIENTATION=-